VWALRSPIRQHVIVGRASSTPRPGARRTLWPRPGRVFAAARSHTFAELTAAIDTAFALWNRAPVPV
jgi:hypothetical protein